jgi:hypothetical protein
MFITKITNLRTKRLVKAVYLFVLSACCASSAVIAQTSARPCFDFTGSGRTSFATLNRNSTGINFRILGNGGATGGSLQSLQYGLSSTDVIAPGYFDNDNRADLNIYRTTQATYFLRPSTATAANTFQSIPFGAFNDVAGLEANYDGDGRDDLTIVRDGAVNITWFFLRSSNNTVGVVNFGTRGFTTGAGDTPIAGADYNGDGRAEVTVIRNNPTGADIYLAGDTTTGALVTAQPWGECDTDFFVVGDYLGDRRADFAVYRAFQGSTTGTWFVRENGGAGATITRAFGLTSLASVPTVRFAAITTATANRISPFTARRTAVFTGSTVPISIVFRASNSVSRAIFRLPVCVLSNATCEEK